MNFLGTKLPYYFGKYEYRFSDSWSHFSHRCLHISELKFQLGPKTRTSSRFTTMFGKYRTGKINRLNAKFIAIPYKVSMIKCLLSMWDLHTREYNSVNKYKCVYYFFLIENQE